MREEIGGALIDYLGTVTWGEPRRGFVYRSERLQHPEDAPGQPALYTRQGDERYSQRRGLPPIRDLEFYLVVYQDVGRDPSHPRPASENDMILEAIEEALRSNLTPDERQTLGGLVNHARIEGTILKDSGDLGGQGVMMIPILVTVP